MRDGVAQTTRSTFRYEVGVEQEIEASAERVWALITDAQALAGWNSTVRSIEGLIEDGGTIALVAEIAPERVFKLKVATPTPGRVMTWSDGFAPMFRGVRTYKIEELGPGRVRFSMREVFSGLMLPMIAGSLPDFGPDFEAWVACLKREAEAG